MVRRGARRGPQTLPAHRSVETNLADLSAPGARRYRLYIEKDLSKDFGPDAVDCTPLTFAFCGCADGLPDFPVNTRARRTDEGWGAVAAFFLRDVPNPGTKKHRELMLLGTPSPAMVIRFIRGL